MTQIGQVAIRDALAPLWREKPVTAAKALERLGIVIKHAAAMGLDVDLQATMKARLLLGKPRHQVEHIPAMPWAEVPAFYASLGRFTDASCLAAPDPDRGSLAAPIDTSDSTKSISEPSCGLSPPKS